MSSIFDLRGLKAGVENEGDLLGLPQWKPGYPEKLTQVRKEMGFKVDPEFMMAEIREGYAGDVRNPSVPFAKELRNKICESLGLNAEMYQRVHYYTTLRTPLDRHHGTDFVIEIEIPPADKYVKTRLFVFVTADVTLQVKTEWKSDIVVNTIPSVNSPDFQPAVAFTAEQFADVFRKKLTNDQIQRLGIKPKEAKVRGRIRMVRPSQSSSLAS